MQLPSVTLEGTSTEWYRGTIAQQQIDMIQTLQHSYISLQDQTHGGITCSGTLPAQDKCALSLVSRELVPRMAVVLWALRYLLCRNVPSRLVVGQESSMLKFKHPSKSQYSKHD